MLLLDYVTLVLKQLVRIRMAFFFTLAFPVILYLFNGYSSQPTLLIVFFNFAMQSAMLQTVGMFVSVQKNTTWGQYVSTLPAPPVYSALGTIIAMFIIGVLGIVLIGCIDLFWFHTLSLNSIVLALLGAMLGAFPAGALGYLIGVYFDPTSARNLLILVNLAFLFITFVSGSIQHILSWFFLPNVWLDFSWNLVMDKHAKMYDLMLLIAYFALFLAFIKWSSIPKNSYQDS